MNSILKRKLLQGFCMSLLWVVAISAQAKEVLLVLNMQSQYPMQIHYKFSNGGVVYGQGKMTIQPADGPHHVAVNRIDDDEDVLVQIDKMTVGPWTEINDPCEINLGQTHLTANITIGFTGNPDGHGSFNCNVSAS